MEGKTGPTASLTGLLVSCILFLARGGSGNKCAITAKMDAGTDGGSRHAESGTLYSEAEQLAWHFHFHFLSNGVGVVFFTDMVKGSRGMESSRLVAPNMSAPATSSCRSKSCPVSLLS